MIELNHDRAGDLLPLELQRLRERAVHHRSRHRQRSRPFATLVAHARTTPDLQRWLRQLPSRYLLHSVVALLFPVALLLGQLPLRPAPQTLTPPTAAPVVAEGDVPLIILGPLNLDAARTGEVVGDPPLEADEALPVPLTVLSRSEQTAPLIVPATIIADVAKVRNGPGLAYDDIARLTSGATIEVVGRYGEWLQFRTADDPSLRWIAAELVNVPEAVFYNLKPVADAAIPPPPPPKVASVREDGLNLRDGPGTNYVSMKRLTAGQELTLVEQFNGWFLVETGGLYGWVTAEFLNIAPGVIERVPVAATIPDPNPPLVGAVIENSVNLRKGPGSAYDRIGAVNAGTEVKLLARHKDWYRVELSNGTKAWIYAELLQVTPMAARRVPYTNDIPALPNRSRLANSGPVNIPASGDVASYAVQFVGYRYVWGGSSPVTGFDCSGLTWYVYRQFGVSLPRTAASQFNTRYGALISNLNNLTPGDLMFFANTGGGRGITHVAIYIGNGQMVHAMTPAYGVQISSIWGSYWTSRFAGAIRPYR
ncbi:MAG: SH3 domain-containing protein [Chloroflexus sp.]